MKQQAGQVASHKLFTPALVPALGDDRLASSSVFSLLLTAGLSAAGLLGNSSASAGSGARSGCSLLAFSGSTSLSCLTGSGLSDEGSMCFAVGLLAACALTVFDSLHLKNREVYDHHTIPTYTAHSLVLQWHGQSVFLTV